MKMLLAVALIFLSLQAIGQHEKIDEKIKGKPVKVAATVTGDIKGMPLQTVVIEQLKANNNISFIDSAHSDANGHFKLNIFSGSQELYRLRFDNNHYIFLSIAKDKVHITADYSNMDAYKVTGSKASEEMRRFMAFFRENAMELNELKSTSDSLKRNGHDSLALITTKNMDQQRIEFFAAVRDTAFNTVYEPNAVLAARLLNPAQERDFLERINKHLAERFPGTELTKDFADFIDKMEGKSHGPQVGDAAPDVRLSTPNGDTVSLSSYKGHYVLLDFWASWCGPCRGENPNVVRAYNKFKDKNFTILGVSLDNNKEAWQKAINADGLSWAQVSELKGWSSEVAVEYGIQSIPQNFLIDPSGKIIAHNLRGPELEQKLETTLK